MYLAPLQPSFGVWRRRFCRSDVHPSTQLGGAHMKREKTFLTCIVLALCLFPGLAAAEETVQAAVPAPAQSCDDLGFLAQAPASSATLALNLDPLGGVVEAQGGACCRAKRLA